MNTHTTTIDKVPRFKFSETARGDGELNPIPIKEFLTEKYASAHTFGSDYLIKYGVYRLMGYQYDFKQYLKKYYYTTKYGNSYTAYAPNIKMLKRVVGWNVRDIVQVTE